MELGWLSRKRKKWGQCLIVMDCVLVAFSFEGGNVIVSWLMMQSNMLSGLDLGDYGRFLF